MKSFKDYLFEENKIKPVSSSREIPSKLPPKANTSKMKKKVEAKTESPERKIEDKFIKSEPTGFKPYTRGKK